MKRFHIIFGLVVVIVFLLTGQYMDRYFNHLEGMPDGPRLLYRTRHIFILLAGLLNLGIGTYFRDRELRDRRIMQMLGSVLIVVATILFVAAFFYEPRLTNLHTPLSHWGMYSIVAGTFLHLLSGLGPRGAERNDPPEKKSAHRSSLISALLFLIRVYPRKSVTDFCAWVSERH